VLLLHVPPPVLFVNVVVAPTHMLAVPPIEAGTLFTVTVIVLLQPPAAYVIVDVPEATPVTTPVVPSIVATLPLLLLHAPPLTACVSVVVLPTHTLAVPPIDANAALTVTSVMLRQPPDNV